MKIEVKENLKIVTPSANHYLTQVNLGKFEERVFSDKLYMPLSADEFLWTEWTEAQKQYWEQEYSTNDSDD